MPGGLEWHMGNENEVKKIPTSAKSKFLPDEIRDPEGMEEVYSLEEEFVKTKKNRNFLLILFVIGFVVLLVLSVYFYDKYMQNQMRAIEVDISDTKDIELKELIDATRKNASLLDELKMELENMRILKLNSLLEIESNILLEKSNVIARLLPGNEEEKELGKLEDLKKEKFMKIDRIYDGKLRAKKHQINEVAHVIRKNEKILKNNLENISNYDRLYAIKMNLTEREIEWSQTD